MSEALMPISDIHVGQRYRRDLGDIDALAASIKAVGLLHAIVVAVGSDGRLQLVAGQRRLEAVKALGWERIPVRMLLRSDDGLRAEHDENVIREPFTPSESARIAAALRPIEQAASRERMSAGGKGGQIDHPSRTEDRIAEAVGMSRNTLAKAEAVVEAADENPDLAPIVEAMDETGNVSAAHRALQSLPPDPAPGQVQEAVRASRITPGVMSSNTDEWLTPRDVLTATLATWPVIDLDPCAEPGAVKNVPASTHFTAADDGLSRSWSGRAFVNPPYSRVAAYAEKVALEAANIREAIVLVPARTETRWWRTIPASVVCFFDGRLRFVDPTAAKNGSAPFPSAALYVGAEPEPFMAAFAPLGLIYRRVEP